MFFDPRKRWNYMGQGRALPERFWGSSNRMANQRDADSPTGFKAELSGLMGPQYGEGGNAAINAAMARQSNPLSRTSAGELSAKERAEAWKQAMADMPGPMQGDTIPGVPPGGGSRDHQASTYGMGIDLEENNPISDPDAVRKRLYGLMGFRR